MSWKGRTFDSRRDLTFSETGQGLDRVTTNPCPEEVGICLSQVTESIYETPSAIRVRGVLSARLRVPETTTPVPRHRGCWSNPGHPVGMARRVAGRATAGVRKTG